MSTKGFLGVYEPDPEEVVRLLLKNVKVSEISTCNVTTTGGGGGGGGSLRRRLLAVSNVTGSIFTGIANPTICLQYGDLVLFSVSKEHYPVYEK